MTFLSQKKVKTWFQNRRMKHKKLLRKQGGSANSGSASNGNQSDENCEEEKSNADSIAEPGDIDDNEPNESLDTRDRGKNW